MKTHKKNSLSKKFSKSNKFGYQQKKETLILKSKENISLPRTGEEYFITKLLKHRSSRMLLFSSMFETSNGMTNRMIHIIEKL